ncbi:hypothetical protein ACHAXR_012819 [Thalassiosira sp. AJA248-18]
MNDSSNHGSSSGESDDDETGLLMNRISSQEETQWQLEEDRASLPQSPAGADPHAPSIGGNLYSATFGIIKGMVGPAILYLPHGFAQAGYIVAVPVLLLSTCIFLWSSSCLLQSWKIESERVNRKRLSDTKINLQDDQQPTQRRIKLSYPELAYRAFGETGERLVKVGISLMQSGVCLTYLIFVPQNLRAVALLFFNWDISTNWILVWMVVVQIPLSWIRDIRKLTFTNCLANGLILYGLITCLGFAMYDMAGVDPLEHAQGGMSADVAIGESGGSSFLQEVVHRAQSLPAFNPSGWFLFLGTSVLLFEGSITLLVPLQEALDTATDRDEFPHLYFRVILSIVSFYAFFGISCWMAFGDDVHTVMTTSLPTGTLATTVQLAYSLAVVFTFPLQNFPSLEIVCTAVEQMLKSSSDEVGSDGISDGSSSSHRKIISTILIILLSVIAVLTMDHLDKVVSLMGSLLGCPLAFVVPPLIQNQIGVGQIGERKQWLNIMVVCFGVSAMIISSITTIRNWD